MEIWGSHGSVNDMTPWTLEELKASGELAVSNSRSEDFKDEILFGLLVQYVQLETLRSSKTSVTWRHTTQHLNPFSPRWACFTQHWSDWRTTVTSSGTNKLQLSLSHRFWSLVEVWSCSFPYMHSQMINFQTPAALHLGKIPDIH